MVGWFLNFNLTFQFAVQNQPHLEGHITKKVRIVFSILQMLQTFLNGGCFESGVVLDGDVMDGLTRFSLYDCHLSCISQDGCVAFQFRYSENLCYLFDHLEGRDETDDDDIATGYAECNHKLRGIHVVKGNDENL